MYTFVSMHSSTMKRSACLLLLVCSVQCSNIIGVFPFGSKSHHILGSALLKELADRGHHVTMISPFPLEKPYKNYKDVYLDDILELDEGRKVLMAKENATQEEKHQVGMNTKRVTIEAIFNNDNFKDFMESKPDCDVVIIMSALAESLLIIGHELGCPSIPMVVLGGQFFVDHLTGNYAPYSYVPTAAMSYGDEMTFWQRAFNTFGGWFLTQFYQNNIAFHNSLLAKYYPSGPTVYELIEKIDLIFTNSNPATETPRMYASSEIRIGGFHIKQNQTLPKDLKNFLDGSKNGVILFSFGTNVRSSTLSDDLKNNLLRTFRKSKYDILWKFEADLPEKPNNVKISNWLPQQAVLEHPKVIGFISHCAYGSINEAMFFAVPMVCIPFFGEQITSAVFCERSGIATRLPPESVTEESLSNAIREITENPDYYEKIALKSDLLRNQEVSPMDRAVHWVNHVIKYRGAKHLQLRSVVMPWYQVKLIDVYAFYLILLVAVVLCLWFIVRNIVKLFKYLLFAKSKTD